MSSRPLLDILKRPESLINLAPPEQTLVLRQARTAGLLGYIAARLELSQLPGKLGDALLSGKIHADYQHQKIAWEIDRLAKALAPLPGPVILLKGAAYQALELEVSKGRLASDVDLLLPRDQLDEAERLLLHQGWSHLATDDYEQHFYREWAHELPPLQHDERGTVVDLHHNILPPTARLKPSAAALIGSARPVAGTAFYALSPEDNLLHRAVHLFFDGDLSGALRELLDIDELFASYGDASGFADRLAARGRELGLARPLYYAAHFCRELFDSAHAGDVAARLQGAAPPLPVRLPTQAAMRALLMPADPDRESIAVKVAGALLYMRSHWLRMPPLMLARHLITQTRRRGGIKPG